jgi:hypothetical protein
MKRFNEEDVTIEHAKLVRGGGYLRLTHRPSGLFVDADLKSESVIGKKNAMMKDLEERVLAWQEEYSWKGVTSRTGSAEPGQPGKTGENDAPLGISDRVPSAVP